MGTLHDAQVEWVVLIPSYMCAARDDAGEKGSGRWGWVGHLGPLVEERMVLDAQVNLDLLASSAGQRDLPFPGHVVEGLDEQAGQVRTRPKRSTSGSSGTPLISSPPEPSPLNRLQATPLLSGIFCLSTRLQGAGGNLKQMMRHAE